MSACPSCNTPLEITPDLRGRQVKCPKCGAIFTVPGVVVQTPPPIDTAIQISQSNGRRSFRSTLQPATSIWDLLDWRFTKYLTPWIVRATWMMAVFTFSMFAIIYLGSEIVDLLPESTIKQRDGSTIRHEFRVPEVEVPVIFRILTNKVFRIFGIVASTVWGLLWVRVFLEMVIVAFNIAASVSRIEHEAIAVTERSKA